MQAEYLEFRLSFNSSCANVNVSGVVASPPAPVSVVLENATSTTYVVQDVMEYAADTSTAYKFTVTFQVKATGYTIDAVSGLETAEDCQWYLFYRAPGEEELQYQFRARISYFVVASNSTVVLSYEPEPVLPPEPSPTPTPGPNNGAAPAYTIANCLAVVLCLATLFTFQ